MSGEVATLLLRMCISYFAATLDSGARASGWAGIMRTLWADLSRKPEMSGPGSWLQLYAAYFLSRLLIFIDARSRRVIRLTYLPCTTWLREAICNPALPCISRAAVGDCDFGMVLYLTWVSCDEEAMCILKLDLARTENYQHPPSTPTRRTGVKCSVRLNAKKTPKGRIQKIRH